MISSFDVEGMVNMDKDISADMKKSVIAIIPARSGSKGLKDKNIKELNGKPLIGYSIEAALMSGLFDTVHVSTDSQHYADIAIAYGADEPFLRDVENAGDTSSSWDVVREVLRKYHDIGREYDICVLLQPTSPLRTTEDICEAFDVFLKTKAKSLTSVVEVEHPIQWCFTLDETMSMKYFAGSPYKECRRQELEKHYRENGAIYIVGSRDICSREFDFYTSECAVYMMEKERSIDIDTIYDFAVAEAFLKMQQEEK